MPTLLLAEFLLRFEDQHLNRPFQRPPKHRSQILGFLLQNACDLPGDLVHLSVVIHLEQTLFEILPLEGAVLNPVFAKLDVDAVGELSPSRPSGHAHAQPCERHANTAHFKREKMEEAKHSSRNYAPWCNHLHATCLESKPMLWITEMVH